MAISKKNKTLLIIGVIAAVVLLFYLKSAGYLAVVSTTKTCTGFTSTLCNPCSSTETATNCKQYKNTATTTIECNALTNPSYPYCDPLIWNQRTCTCSYTTVTPTCSDTDSGKNYAVRGTLTALYSDGKTATFRDECGTNNQILENYCSGTSPATQLYTCQNYCLNGACVPLPQSCTDSDGGKTWATRGTTTGINSAGNSFTNTDSCDSNGVTLTEYTCVDGVSVPAYYPCPGVCSNGACQPCESHDISKCSGGNRVWYDSCGNKEDMRESCDGLGCSSDKCGVPATPTPPPPTPTPTVAPECSVGQTVCTSATTIHTCGSNGMWLPTQPCPISLPNCVNNACTAIVVDECAAGANRCYSESQIQSCGANNKWSDVLVCPSDRPVCDNEANVCKASGSTPNVNWTVVAIAGGVTVVGLGAVFMFRRR